MSYLTDKELPPLSSDAMWAERIKTLMQQAGLPDSHSVYSAMWQLMNELQHAFVRYARAAIEADRRKHGEPVAWPDDLSSNQRTKPERFGVIYKDDGTPVVDDDDFRFDALIVVHGDFDQGEKDKYVVEVCRRLNGIYPTPQPTPQERQDAERLQYLIEHSAMYTSPKAPLQLIWQNAPDGYRKDLRAAIDAAMSKEPGHE